MNIYPSSRVLPYVYKLTHKETGQFYFGYRCANKSPSSEDLGIHYFTSSNQVKLIGFENFEFEVLAEFFDKQDAIDFENLMISEEWDNSLILNRGYGGAKFRNISHTAATKAKMSCAASARVIPNEQREKISASMMGHPTSEETRKKISESLKNSSKVIRGKSGRIVSDETKAKLSHFRKNLSDEAKLKLSIAQKARYAKASITSDIKPTSSE